MSNELVLIDTETQIGALQCEAHWTLVLAGTGGGLVLTWLAHMMQWTPLAFVVHGAAGVVGGYLVGSGVSRALTGVRARPWLRRYEGVSTANRLVASGLRVLLGTSFFYASYLFAVGVEVGVTIPTTFELAMLGPMLPLAIWACVLGYSMMRGIIRAMR